MFGEVELCELLFLPRNGFHVWDCGLLFEVFLRPSEQGDDSSHFLQAAEVVKQEVQWVFPDWFHYCCHSLQFASLSMGLCQLLVDEVYPGKVKLNVFRSIGIVF